MCWIESDVQRRDHCPGVSPGDGERDKYTVPTVGDVVFSFRGPWSLSLGQEGLGGLGGLEGLPENKGS